jgi:hypothetical protein
MDAQVAEELLADEDVIPVLQGSIPYIKELRQKCLDADIPALAGCPPGAGKG